MKKLVTTILLSVLSNTTMAAAQIDDTGIAYVRVDKNGYGEVKFINPFVTGTVASCGASSDSHLSFDTNTPGGKAIMSVALSAYASGKKVSARGTGTCVEYGGTSGIESWSYGWEHD